MSAATADSVCSVGHALGSARQQLGHSPAATREAELLLAHVMSQPRSFVRAHAEDMLAPGQQQTYAALIERRVQGEPVAYLTGCCGFWSFEIAVASAVLVPRPETELLVEQALARIPEDASWQIADLGTGSCAIALAIAHERPRCRIIATDVSAVALEVARANAVRLNIRNVDFRLGDWFDALQGDRFDMIVSNPPYVRDNDPHLPALRFEPTLALTAGDDGLQCLRDIATQARGHFTPTLTLPHQGGGDENYSPSPQGEGRGEGGGWLLLEHGYDQGAVLTRLLDDLGYASIQDYPDLANIPRLAVAQWVVPHA